MTHIDLDNSVHGRHAGAEAERQARLLHTQSMLYASLVASISIVVVAALFMTLF